MSLPNKDPAWLSLLPAWIGNQLKGRQLYQRVLGNTSWMIADKVVRLLVGLFVTILIARHLGPTGFGLFNYVQAYVALFTALSTLGLQSIVVRDLVASHHKKNEILAAALALRIAGAMIAIILVAVSISWFRPNDQEAWLLVVVFALALLPQATEVIDFRYQSVINFKPIVIIRNLVFIVFSLIKVAIIFYEGSVLAFVIAFSLEAAVSGVIVMAYSRMDGVFVKRRYLFRSTCWHMLKECWPLIISGLSVMIYMRVDQIMLGQILGDEAVGVYSAATRISEAWYFVPVAIIASVAPILTKLHLNASGNDYEYNLLRVMRLLTWLSILAALVLTIIASPLIIALYGEEYKLAADVLVIHAWAGIFVCLGVAAGPWFTNAKLLHLSMYQTILGASVNVALNLVLIPEYGVTGAAFATIISYAVSAVLFNAVLVKTRPVFILQLRSFFR